MKENKATIIRTLNLIGYVIWAVGTIIDIKTVRYAGMIVVLLMAVASLSIRRCPYCSRRILNDNAYYCPHCGKQLMD